MNTLNLCSLRAILLGGLTLCQTSLLAAPNDGKVESLFNGKDLTGWTAVHEVTFDVNDGNLRLVKGMGWLRTNKEYKDFILELEWRALDEQYDSGIFFRVGLDGKPWPKDGWQVNLRYNGIGQLVRGYKTVLPAETPKQPLKQWIKMRLEVRGKKAILDMNGERSWETEVIDREAGYLGIQAEDKAFEFRNLRVQELEPGAPAQK